MLRAALRRLSYNAADCSVARHLFVGSRRITTRTSAGFAVAQRRTRFFEEIRARPDPIPASILL
jgi:hypothetical protein